MLSKPSSYFVTWERFTFFRVLEMFLFLNKRKERDGVVMGTRGSVEVKQKERRLETRAVTWNPALLFSSE